MLYFEILIHIRFKDKKKCENQTSECKKML